MLKLVYGNKRDGENLLLIPARISESDHLIVRSSTLANIPPENRRSQHHSNPLIVALKQSFLNPRETGISLLLARECGIMNLSTLESSSAGDDVDC
jgi:hypothetical protein